MRTLNICMLGILILTTFKLYSQEDIYIGMPADEFKIKLPGVLPDKIKYNADLNLPEKLHSIDGEWSFHFNENILNSINFNDKGAGNIKSENEFNKWTESAKLIIDDYTKIYGQPVKYENGANKYLDRNNPEYKKSLSSGKREVFYEAIWKTRTMSIKISCDYRSNYYKEFQKEALNGPVEWFNFYFQITYSSISEIKDAVPDEPGRFYLGLNVNTFAKKFPELFPEGIKISGQYTRDADLYGLKGTWVYNFENGKLTWIHFDKYINEINDANFTNCLSTTRQLIKDYTTRYGEPDTTIIGNSTFIDPLQKMHYGYEVLDARWKNYKGMKIKIEFTFFGGKGQYFFLVKINYFDKDYPYYD